MRSAGEGSTDRILTPALRFLERDYRRKGALAENDSFVDWTGGKLAALYENGAPSSDRPRTVLPWSKPDVISAYSNQLMVFVGSHFGRACALAAVIRAELYEGRLRIVFSGGGPTQRFSMIEITPTDRRAGDFIEGLLFRRDVAAAGIPDLERHMDGIKLLRSVPAEDVLDKLVIGPWEPRDLDT